MKPPSPAQSPGDTPREGKVKLETYGAEMLEKKVGFSGSAGQLYLPKDWVGSRVKIIRLN